MVDHLPERDQRLARQIETLRKRVNQLEQKIAHHAGLEQQLKALGERYRGLLDSIPAGVVVLDARTGDITDANPAFQRLTGRSLQVLRTFRLWELVPVSHRQSVVDWLRKSTATFLSTGKGTCGRVPGTVARMGIERPDRRVIWTEATLGWFFMQGTPRLLCFCRGSVGEKVRLGLAVIDRQYRVLWSNETYRLFRGSAGVPPVGCYGLVCGASQKEVPPTDCPARETFRTGKMVSIEKTGVETAFGPGRTLWITTGPVPWRVQAGPQSTPVQQVLECVQDITDLGSTLPLALTCRPPAGMPVPPTLSQGERVRGGHTMEGGRATSPEAVSVYRSIVQQGDGKTVLVIDDDPGVRDITARMLERLGYQVLLAEGVEKAVALCASHTGEIHAAVLDIGLPSWGWEATLQHLRAARPGMEVVLCSGECPDEQIRAWVKAGVVKFLPKPFRFNALAEVMRALLGNGSDTTPV